MLPVTFRRFLSRGLIGAALGTAAFGVPASVAQACDWGVALKNIAWVIDQDPRARSKFLYNIDCNPIGRKQCVGPYEAVLLGQGHNGHAQNSIRACEGQARQFLRDRGYGG